MYIPYFRGKQFDLMALIEAVEGGFLSKDIIPLIEPVRDNKYLRKVAEAFIRHKHHLLIIVNPQVGRVQIGQEKIHRVDDLYIDEYITPVCIINEDLISSELHDIIETEDGDFVFLTTSHQKDLSDFLAHSRSPKFHIITDSALLRTEVQKKRILLDDPFTLLKHGEEYLELEDEFFSDADKSYLEEGYLGFANYGIDGASYFDKGYPSRTMVLHVLYLDRYNSLRIKHFASDSNETMANPGGKFFEALRKLTAWVGRHKDKINLTQGLQRLMEYETENKYPGAGVIKKLLVMHQLELYSEMISSNKTGI